MHYWGDEGVDWKGISDAARYIGQGLRKWGRIGTSYKEKFGTVRVYCGFGWYQFHCITHPGYHYNQYPKWLWELDCTYGWRIMRPLSWAVKPYHRWLYRRYYLAAVRKWPHLWKEILSGADYPELLRGLEIE